MGDFLFLGVWGWMIDGAFFFGCLDFGGLGIGGWGFG